MTKATYKRKSLFGLTVTGRWKSVLASIHSSKRQAQQQGLKDESSLLNHKSMKQRAWPGSVARLLTHKAQPRCCTFSNKAPPTNGSTTSPEWHPQLRPSVGMLEPMEAMSHLNNHSFLTSKIIFLLFYLCIEKSSVCYCLQHRSLRRRRGDRHIGVWVLTES